MDLDLATAMLLAVAGLSAGVREILLSPANLAFPKAPLFVRAAMFIYAVALAGAAVLFWGASHVRGEYAGSASVPFAIFSAMIAVYNVVMFLNLLSQRYDPALWKRINRMNDTVKASCADKRPPAWNPF